MGRDVNLLFPVDATWPIRRSALGKARGFGERELRRLPWQTVCRWGERIFSKRTDNLCPGIGTGERGGIFPRKAAPFTRGHKGARMSKLAGKKLLLLGERDGIPSPAMEKVFANSGAEVVFAATECFV